jgi:hypothetical protein
MTLDEAEIIVTQRIWEEVIKNYKPEIIEFVIKGSPEYENIITTLISKKKTKTVVGKK